VKRRPRRKKAGRAPIAWRIWRRIIETTGRFSGQKGAPPAGAGRFAAGWAHKDEAK